MHWVSDNLASAGGINGNGLYKKGVKKGVKKAGNILPA